MKPALVLGLALAANAFSAEQLDNELIIAPRDEFGNIKQYPRNIRFDEQADDELLVRPISTYVADDELRVAPRDENGNIKYPNPWIRYDDEGNEFFVVPTHRLGEMGHKSLYDNELARYTSDVKELLERQMEYKGRFDDEADDELLAKSDPYEAQENYQYPSGVSTKLFVNRQKQAEALRRDDEADDELIVVAKDEFGKIKPSYIKYDKEGNELWFFSIPRYGNLNGRIPGIVADDELMISPFSRRRFENAEEGKTLEVNALAAHARIVRHKKSHPGLDQFTKKHPEIALDDELLMRSTSAQFDDNEFIKAPKNKYPGNVMYDDEADDELFASQRAQENSQKPGGKKRDYFSEVRAQGMRNEAEGSKRNGALPKKTGPQTRPQQPAEKKQAPGSGVHPEKRADKKTERNGNYQALKKDAAPQPHPSQPENLQSHEQRMFAEMIATDLRRKAERNMNYQGLKDGGSQPQEKQTPSGVFVEMRALGLRENGPATLYVTADDELHSKDHMSRKLFADRQRHPEASQKDDEADNELASHFVVDHSEQIRYGKKPSNKPSASSRHNHPKGSLRPTLFVNKQRPAKAPKTKEADEILTIPDPNGAQSNQPGPDGVSTKLFVDRQPQAMKNDDEFFASHVSSEVQNNHQKPRGLKPTLFVNKKPQVMQNDDEGDDELAYLGDLLNEAQKKGLPSRGAFGRVFDDDEFLVERPALLNHQGVPSGAFVRVLDDNDDELFEVKGKVRPFLPFS